ncbi:MAG: hypothetical protein GX443_18635 [Deltaproteobacteria bacterium]|nr:hypothetical protein [Deltaproteobacteria bacterium]
MSHLPRHVRQVARVIHDAGFGVWIVGGALRDHFMGIPPKDWDVATTASPEDVVRLFPRVFPVGMRHGTVSVLAGRGVVEVTRLREADGRGSVFADLARRDFTVNALALDYPTGRLLDPFQGRRDLRRGILRAVGDPTERFREDPLRVLRACRLVAQYGFRIERRTFLALRREVHGLQSVAPERIRDEIFKLILGKHVLEGFTCMHRGGVMEQILPELQGRRVNAEREHAGGGSCDSMALLAACPRCLNLRLAALFHQTGERSESRGDRELEHGRGFYTESAAVACRVLQRWRASRRRMKEVTHILEHHFHEEFQQWDDEAIRRFLANIELERLEDILLFSRACFVTQGHKARSRKAFDSFRWRVQGIVASGELILPAQLAIDGEDVMEILGIGPGPQVGAWLKKLHEKVLQNPCLNERKILVDFLKKAGL